MTTPNHLTQSPCTLAARPGMLDESLIRVQKPARYLGGEVNAVTKNPCEVGLRVGLCFPDVYEVGMSHLGLKILYSIINARSDLYAERAFAPWPDMELLLREQKAPLTTLETGTPLSGLDLVGFSLQYELCATTVLQMLQLGGIPLRSEHRGRTDPFVVGGGPAAFNPIPLAPFFDAFAIGDGEEVILELADAQLRWKGAGGSREELLGEWKRIPGVFVPSLHSPGDIVSKRITASLDEKQFPARLVVPFAEIIHDRIGIEIARGCTRGCRFCQAGMLYRPVRERPLRTVMDLSRQSLCSTGWEEVALLSLSAGDYSSIGDLIKTMTETFGPEKVAISLPSLRTDTFDSDMAHQIRKVRKTGFTLAPEAGTDRLRRIINKGNTEEDLEKAVTSAFKLGWQSVKLYFMIGLPQETDEDLDGMADLIRKASKWARGGKITASVSTFVPKSHTPFQWAGQISTEETVRRQQYIRRYFQRGKVRLKFHNPTVSFLEGIIARGDRDLSTVIERAFAKGARLDGWDDQLRFDLWMDAFQEAKIDPQAYLEPRAVESKLPWDFIDTRVRPEYLVEEWRKAIAKETTPDCRGGECTGCGVCDFDQVRPRLAPSFCNDQPEPSSIHTPALKTVVRRFRLCYSKIGQMRFLGHQDMIRLFQRSFRRAGIGLDYSRGFHPHPKLRFSPPLALGVESVAEYLDFDVMNSRLTVEEISHALQQHLPEGISSLDLNEISLNDPPISAKIRQVTYEITFLDSLSPEAVKRQVDAFLSAPVFEIVKVHKGKAKSRDLKEWIEDVDCSGQTLKIAFRVEPNGSVHPLDAAAAILGLSRDKKDHLRILKTSVRFETFSHVSHEIERLKHGQ